MFGLIKSFNEINESYVLNILPIRFIYIN